jgi:hypothetical protein
VRASSDEWASASDLAEYAYCPRAWYYRKNFPGAPVSPQARSSSQAGERYHRATLAAELRRERYGAGYALALLVALALVVGGVAWFLR